MLEVSGIYKHYRKKEILKAASFKAEAGSCIGIVGGNGCGKTTLLSILAGVNHPDKGCILLDGKDALKDKRIFTEQIAYVPQENPIIPELTARDNFRLWYKGNKRSMEEDIDHGVAKALGLEKFMDTPAGRLSGGQKKRLSIACSLSNHASVMILDEPGAALDLAAKEEILSYIASYVKQGGTVILTSHEMAELLACDRLYILKDGVLEETCGGLSAEELIKKF